MLPGMLHGGRRGTASSGAGGSGTHGACRPAESRSLEPAEHLASAQKRSLASLRPVKHPPQRIAKVASLPLGPVRRRGFGLLSPPAPRGFDRRTGPIKQEYEARQKASKKPSRTLKAGFQAGRYLFEERVVGRSSKIALDRSDLLRSELEPLNCRCRPGFTHEMSSLTDCVSSDACQCP